MQAHEKINNLKINLATMETEKYYRETRSSKLMEKDYTRGLDNSRCNPNQRSRRFLVEMNLLSLNRQI